MQVVSTAGAAGSCAADWSSASVEGSLSLPNQAIGFGSGAAPSLVSSCVPTTRDTSLSQVGRYSAIEIAGRIAGRLLAVAIRESRSGKPDGVLVSVGAVFAPASIG